MHFVPRICALVVTISSLLGAWWVYSSPATGEPTELVQEQGEEVLTRGPVHEAFGRPVDFDPEPGIIVPKQPAEAIEELPPEEKPAGDNVQWIGGYWGWDP